MKRVWVLVLCGLFVACSTSDKPGKKKKATAAKKAVKEAPAERAPAEADDALPAGLEGQLLAIDDCEPESEASGSFVKECAAIRSFRGAAKAAAKKDPGVVEAHRELARQYLTHESGRIRAGAVHLLAASKPDEGDMKAIIALAKSEGDGLALDSMMNLLDPEIAANQKVQALYLQLAKHDHPAVREHVAIAFGRSTTAKIAERFDILLAMAENDVEPGPRNAACRRLGALGDARALPLLDKLTADPTSEPERRTACFAGLIGLWASSVPHPKPSQGAWALTLERLSVTPRSETHPPWQAIAGIGFATKSKFRSAAPWYDNKATIGVLLSVIRDRKASVRARVAAVRTIDRLGAGLGTFNQLQKMYGEADGAEQPIRAQIDKVILSHK